MPRTRTLLQLRNEARQYADMEGSAFVSDAEVTRYINLGNAELWHVLVQADPDRYLSRVEIATVAGTYEYEVPEDFASARVLEKLGASGSEDAYRLEPYNLSEGHVGQDHGSFTLQLRWAIVYQGVDGADTRLRFQSDPGSGFVRLWYVSAPVELDDDADVWDGVAGWEEFSVLWAAEQMVAKEESDPSLLIRRRQELTQRIHQVAGSRIIGTAPSVARVRNRRRWSRG